MFLNLQILSFLPQTCTQKKYINFFLFSACCGECEKHRNKCSSNIFTFTVLVQLVSKWSIFCDRFIFTLDKGVLLQNIDSVLRIITKSCYLIHVFSLNFQLQHAHLALCCPVHNRETCFCAVLIVDSVNF